MKVGTFKEMVYLCKVQNEISPSGVYIRHLIDIGKPFNRSYLKGPWTSPGLWRRNCDAMQQELFLKNILFVISLPCLHAIKLCHMGVGKTSSGQIVTLRLYRLVLFCRVIIQHHNWEPSPSK